MTSFIILIVLASLAVAGTVITVLRDGYRRAPAHRAVREYERDDHFRAWTGRS